MLSKNHLKRYYPEIEICEVDSVAGQQRLRELGLQSKERLRSTSSLLKGAFVQRADLNDDQKSKIERIYNVKQGA